MAQPMLSQLGKGVMMMMVSDGEHGEDNEIPKTSVGTPLGLESGVPIEGLPSEECVKRGSTVFKR